MDNLWFLQERDFFDGLEKEKEEFLSCASKKIYNKFDPIFNETDATHGCYYIEQGLVRVYNSSHVGKETIFFMHQKGNLFGISELLGNNNRSSMAQALTKTEIYYIQHSDFENLLKKHFVLSQNTIAVLGSRVRKLSYYFNMLSTSSAISRLAYILITLSYNNTSSGYDFESPIEIPYKLSQEQLATMIGSTQPTVSLLLNELIENKLILSTKQPITLLNPHLLYKTYIESSI